MMQSRRSGIFIWAMLFCVVARSQSIQVIVVDEKQSALSFATVEMLRAGDSSLLKVQMTDSAGSASFDKAEAGLYLWRISRLGYHAQYTHPFSYAGNGIIVLPSVRLMPDTKVMSNVTVSASRPFIEMQAGKTVVNMEASITSVGATAMEALEKLPGITVDKDGNIAIKGRTGVTVMIDGKQTYLDPSQLASYLQGLNASQISQVEIIENPSARFDAAGNAGIIHLKLKRNRQKGFNGSISSTYAQGRYPKNNNNLQLNYRQGKWNLHMNYALNRARHFTRIYALRTYYEADGTTVSAYLEQPSFMKNRVNSQVLRAGADYAVSNKTAIGINLNGLLLDRSSRGDNTAEWQRPGGSVDSILRTVSQSASHWKNGGAGIYLRHSISKEKELGADIDLVGYDMRGEQFFDHHLYMPLGYKEATKARLPGTISILSGRVDYTQTTGQYKVETGIKSTRTRTDNLADYIYHDGSSWQPDYGKTNHFKYDERIHAAYASIERKGGNIDLQAGLRYELTTYDAHQLGNVVVKDSSFSRTYGSFFPTFFASWKADSLHQFSFSAGRRIDRPPFQRLNPFLFVINKYTYERGNPFYKPQYAWNFELGHSFMNKLMTALSYSYTKDYFSQIFPIDTGGIVYYSVGNMGSMQNLGVSVTTQLSPVKWWSMNLSAILNRKIMKGMVEINYEAKITQLHLNLNNQFRFGKVWTAELGGFFTSRSQHDIQEIVDPAGQLSVGISRTVLQNKGTIKLAARDLFYTQWMKGLTYFTNATEYFKLTRDTRVVNISFTYRFGKTFKSIKRSSGAAKEEMERVGNG